jgi:predicted enzyme related to lactoylglutathione lyase
MYKPKEGAIVHVEITSSDPKASRKFLTKVFGWKFTEMKDAEYSVFQAKNGPGGGLMAPMEGMPVGTVNYVLVKSVEAVSKKITKNGGKILMPKQEIPKIGWFAVYQVPGGFVQAVFQPKGKGRR